MHKILFRGSKEASKVFGITAVALTLSFGFAYATGQQVMRMGANDPQTEIIEGISEALNQGQDPKAFSSLNPTDLNKSLSPFVIVFDSEGKVVAGTAQLDGQIPVPPSGVFDAARVKSESRLTWQPKKDMRIAAVVKLYAGSGESKGFVLAGKSLRETENRARELLKLTGIAWAAALVVSFLAVILLFSNKEENQEHHQELG